MYYLQSRYYDPDVSRFIHEENIGYLGANDIILGYNLFAYCDNKSIINTDQKGYNKILNINRLETDAGVIGGGAVVLGILYLISCM